MIRKSRLLSMSDIKSLLSVFYTRKHFLVKLVAESCFLAYFWIFPCSQLFFKIEKVGEFNVSSFSMFYPVWVPVLRDNTILALQCLVRFYVRNSIAILKQRKTKFSK